MKLIIQNGRIAATATDEYLANETEEAVIATPEDFDLARIGEYRYVGNALEIAPPESIAMWQARTALIDAGLLDDVDAFIAAILDPVERKKAQAKWEFSNTVRRDDPLLSGLALSLGLTDAQINQLFITAAAL